MVQQMVARQPVNVFQGGNGIMGRFENPIQSQNPQNESPANSSAPVTSTFENQPVTVGWTPQGQPVYHGSQAQQSWQAATSPQGQLASADLSPGSEELGGSVPFQKDDTQRDGGFFGWLGGLVKKRPGRHDGETDDEYDERMTRNNERIAVLADAIRHMGNIYNTSKGAPVQRLNNPVAGFEQGLQQRKAERKAKAAAEADAAYKSASLQLKKDAAEADRTYKAMTLGYKDAADKRAQKKMEDDADHWQKQFEYRQSKDKADMDFKKERAKAQDAQHAASLSLGWYRATHSKSGGGSGGSGGSLAGKGGSLTNLSTPRGHMNRKKDLNSIEKKQLKDYLYKNGFITKAAAQKYNNALSEQERGAILNGWIGWAANATIPRAEKFRQNLKDHYGYVETSTVGGGSAKPKAAPKSTSPKGSKRVAKPKGSRGKITV